MGTSIKGESVEQVPKSIHDQLLSDLKTGGFSNPEKKINEIVSSGKSIPIPMVANQNTRLYKLVSTKSDYPTPHPQTEYWISQQQLDLIKKNPKLTNDILGLPPTSHANRFNVFEIQPKPNNTPIVYQSQVATTTTPNSIGVGNATQTIVPNRGLWTEPKAIGLEVKVK